MTEVIQDRLRELEVKSFRGIPHSLHIDFSRPGQLPSSMIIFGANGSGKSSIIDAIEFAFFGQLGGMQNLGTRIYPRIKSMAVDSSPEVTISLSGGASISRKAVIQEDGTFKNVVEAKGIRSGTPFILRRADIMRFYDTSSLQRQLLFSKFFSTDGSGPKNREELLDELDAGLVDVKNKVAEKQQQLADILGVSLENVLHKEREIDDVIREKLHGGLNKDARNRITRRGIKVKTSGYSQGQINRIMVLHSELVQLYKERRELKSSRRKRSSTAKLLPFGVGRSHLQESMLDVGTTLAAAFSLISGADFLSKIELRLGEETETSLRVEVILRNGSTCGPQEIFSEANLDLLAILIYLAVAKASLKPSSALILVLDDVLQSVDAAHRVRTAEHILREFGDWQIIFTAHDRLWFEQLKQIFANSRMDVIPLVLDEWRFDGGPLIKGIQRSSSAELSWVIGNGEPPTIAAKAGQILEQDVQELSWTLPVKIDRRRDDRYELGILWPRVCSALSKSTLASITEEVNRWFVLRNLVGAHYNEWASSAERSDIIAFANSVLALHSSIYCGECMTFVSNLGNGNYSCRCGKTEFH
jgi:recombinational DNA repair ATPase RecF